MRIKALATEINYNNKRTIGPIHVDDSARMPFECDANGKFNGEDQCEVK